MYYSMVGTTVFYFIRNYLKLKRELLHGFCLQFNQTYGLEYAISKKRRKICASSQKYSACALLFDKRFKMNLSFVDVK